MLKRLIPKSDKRAEGTLNHWYQCVPIPRLRFITLRAVQSVRIQKLNDECPLVCHPKSRSNTASSVGTQDVRFGRVLAAANAEWSATQIGHSSWAMPAGMTG